MIKKSGKKLPKIRVKPKMTEEKAIEVFGKTAGYIPLNEDEGYYECDGFKALDTRRLFVTWANFNYNLGLKE